MNSSQKCSSCGMPMRNATDHAAGDGAKPYCRNCASPDGTLKEYDEVLAGMASFMSETQGLAATAARAAAAKMLATMPAWKK